MGWERSLYVETPLFSFLNSFIIMRIMYLQLSNLWATWPCQDDGEV
jgi:hypothetical protein